jgi:hypothetical protein
MPHTFAEEGIVKLSRRQAILVLVGTVLPFILFLTLIFSVMIAFFLEMKANAGNNIRGRVDPTYLALFFGGELVL